MPSSSKSGASFALSDDSRGRAAFHLATTLVGVAMLAIGASAAMAQQAVSLGVSAGAALPVGDLAEIVGTGFEITAMVSVIRSSTSPLFLRVEAPYRQFNGTISATNLRVLGLSGNLIFEPTGPATLRPYVIAGIGLYHSAFGGSQSPATNDIAVNGGVGLTLVRARARIFSELRFHNIFSGANDNDDSRRFVPITLGVTF